MTYKGYTIYAEAITESSVYTLKDDGELDEHDRYMDIEPEIRYYGIDTDEWCEWFETLDELKEFIDTEIIGERVKYLKEKEGVAGLDKEERKELQQLEEVA